MTHPDGEGWGLHVRAHVAFLQRLIDAGQILVSGPVNGMGKRAGFINMTVYSVTQAHDLIAQDPFALEGLIENLPFWNGHLCLALSRAPNRRLEIEIGSCLSHQAIQAAYLVSHFQSILFNCGT